MPIEKELNKMIPKIYRYNYESIALFFFVKAQQQVFPTILISQAIDNFRKFSGVTPDEWDDDCMRSTFTKVQQSFIDLRYNNCIETRHETSKKNK